MDDIGLRVRATVLSESPYAVRFEARIDLADLLPANDLQVAIVGYDADGAARVGPVSPLPVRLTDDQRRRALETGILYQQDVQFGDRMRSARLVVFDNELGLGGSVDVRLN